MSTWHHHKLRQIRIIWVNLIIFHQRPISWNVGSFGKTFTNDVASTPILGSCQTTWNDHLDTNKDSSVTSSVTCIPRMIQQEKLPKIMPNYNGVPLTSFISRVFKKSILLIPNTPSLHYPSEKPLKRRRTRPSMPRGLRQAGFMRLKRSAWVRSCRFLSTACWENLTRRCCQKKTKNTENWRLKMNEPRKVNSFWPWKGII